MAVSKPVRSIAGTSVLCLDFLCTVQTWVKACGPDCRLVKRGASQGRESLATHLRQQFYPKVDPGKIDWFDVVPPNTYSSFDKLTINSVSVQHANGVYSHPSWSPANDNIPEDFAAFILDTIARGQKSCALAESAPHDAPGTKKARRAAALRHQVLVV